MADYLIQESTLDAIADAINAKTGGSSAMTPAQMVTAIGTILGGAPLSGITMTKGSFTVASSIGGTISINHGLAKMPFMVIVMPAENTLVNGTYNLGGIGVHCNFSSSGQYYVGARFYSTVNYPRYTHNPSTDPNANPDTTYICGFTNTKFDYVSSATYPPLAADYQWVAFAFNEEV